MMYENQDLNRPVKMSFGPHGAKQWRDGNDHFHRIDGPAFIWPNGKVEWFVNNHVYSFDNFVDIVQWTGEDIVMYKLGQNLD